MRIKYSYTLFSHGQHTNVSCMFASMEEFLDALKFDSFNKTQMVDNYIYNINVEVIDQRRNKDPATLCTHCDGKGGYETYVGCGACNETGVEHKTCIDCNGNGWPIDMKSSLGRCDTCKGMGRVPAHEKVI